VPAKSTDCQSVEKCGSAGFFGTPVRDLCAKFSAHSVHERACCTISTSTFRASGELLTSLKNAMRAPRYND
jgi:hypothetical protein